MKLIRYYLSVGLFFTLLVPLVASDSLSELQETVKKQTIATRDFYLEQNLWNDLECGYTSGSPSYYRAASQPLSYRQYTSLSQLEHEQTIRLKKNINLLVSYHSDSKKGLNKKDILDLTPLQYAIFTGINPEITALLRTEGKTNPNIAIKNKLTSHCGLCSCIMENDNLIRFLQDRVILNMSNELITPHQQLKI